MTPNPTVLGPRRARHSTFGKHMWNSRRTGFCNTSQRTNLSISVLRMSLLPRFNSVGAKPFTAAKAVPKSRVITVQAVFSQDGGKKVVFCQKVAASIAAAALTFNSPAAMAAFRLPPLDSDPNRCERAFTGNTIGQANAVSDKVLDLRKCDYRGKNLSAKVLSGALVADADFSKTTLKETVFTKARANLTNAVVDRVDFSKANLRGANFYNAVITGTIFKDANLAETHFEDALIGGEDVKRL